MYILTSSTFYFNSNYFKDKEIYLFSAKNVDSTFWFYQYHLLNYCNVIYTNCFRYHFKRYLLRNSISKIDYLFFNSNNFSKTSLDKGNHEFKIFN